MLPSTDPPLSWYSNRFVMVEPLPIVTPAILKSQRLLPFAAGPELSIAVTVPGTGWGVSETMSLAPQPLAFQHDPDLLHRRQRGKQVEALENKPEMLEAETIELVAGH